MTNELAVVPQDSRELALSRDAATRANQLQLSADQVVGQVELVHQIVSRVMKRGTHFDKVPGSKKDVLLQPGAQILAVTFRLREEFTLLTAVEEPDFIAFTSQCDLHHITTGQLIASGVGSCNSREDRFAYRQANRKCPDCGKETLRESKGKDDRGHDREGFYCWKKIEGCGHQFPPRHPEIINQVVGRVPIENTWDQHNAILKRANKRAFVAAIINATAASDVFTQDVDEAMRPARVEDQRGAEEVDRSTGEVTDDSGGDLWKDEAHGAPKQPSHAPVGQTLPPSQFVELATLALKDLRATAGRLNSEPVPVLVAAWGKGMNVEQANKVIAHLSSLSRREVPADSYKTPEFYEKAAKLCSAFASLPDADSRAKLKGGATAADAFGGGVQ